MPNIIYQQYQSLIRALDLSEAADEVFLELIKSGELKRESHSSDSQLPSHIVYVALLKIADQFKPTEIGVLKRNSKNVIAPIFRNAYRWFQKLTNFHTLKFLGYERKINNRAN